MTAQQIEAFVEPEPRGGAVVRMDEHRPTGGALTPMDLIDKALSSGTSVDQLEKLMALQERWSAAQARTAFVEALAAFKANPPTVVKDKKAAFGSGKASYDYATLDQVSAVIGASLSRHGLSHRWEVEQLDGGAIRVTCVLTHVMGHSERASLQAGADQSGSKNSIQAIGSTVTYLERYTLLAITGLAAKGQDSDGSKTHDEPVIDAQQKQEIIDAMKARGLASPDETIGLLKHLKVETLDHLPAREHATALRAIDSRARFLAQQKKAEA
jgi:hypothetical protein